MKLVISRDGVVVAKVPCPPSAGVHRITWNFHEFGVNAEYANGGSGPLALPGKYQATIVQRVRGEAKTLIEKPIDFELVEDPLHPVKDVQPEGIRAFHNEVKQTVKELNATLSTANETASRLELLRKAFAIVEKPNVDAEKRVRVAADTVRELLRKLRGDELRASRNEVVPVSIQERIRYAASVNDDAVAPITTTAKEQLKDGQEELREVTAKLRKIVEAEVPALEKLLDAAGGPALPNRLPAEKK